MTEKYDDRNKEKRSQDSRENKRKRSVKNYTKDNKISWAAIIAGAISFAAVFTVLSLLVGALGLGIFSPNNQNPLTSIGIGVGIATIIILLISFLVSGFIAGSFSKGQALLHGFMSWSLSILLLFSLITTIIAQALGFAGNAAKAVAGTTGNIVGNAASTATDTAKNALSGVGDAIKGIDTKELEENIKNALEETDVKQLQPDYLEGQLNEVKDDITKSGKEILINPEKKDEILNDLSDSLGEKAKSITDSVDKQTIQEEVYKNTSLTAEQSQEAVDNIYNGLNEASKKANEQITNAKDSLEKVAGELDKAVQEAKDGTEKVSNRASFGAVLVFLFLIIGLGVEIYAARLGEEYVNN